MTTWFSDSRPMKLIESHLIEVDGVKRFRIKAVFQRANEINANGRIYPAKLMEREHKALNEKIQAGDSVFMQADHPADGIAKVGDAVALTRSVTFNPATNEVIGEADIVPTSKGKDVMELIRAGAQVGISARGYGSVAKGEVAGATGDVVQEDYRLVTYDFVIGQSTRDAVVKNFEEQARLAVEAILSEDGKNMNVDIKTMDLASFKKERPDLFAAMEADVKKVAADTVAEKTADIETKLIARLEYGGDVKIRKDGEEIQLKKSAGGKSGDRGNTTTGSHTCTEEALKAAALKRGLTLEKKTKDEKDDEDMDEAKIREEAAKLGFTVVKAGSERTESAEVKSLTKTVTELSGVVGTLAKRVEESENLRVKGSVMEHILTVTKADKFKNALVERLANCKTTAEVDAALPRERAAIEKLLREHGGGAGEGNHGAASAIEEIAIDHNDSDKKKTKKYKVEGQVMELSEMQARQVGFAGQKIEELVEA
jgi:hypothetical protein